MTGARAEKFAELAPFVVRLGVSIVFLWFGFSQIFETSMWTAWLPEWTQILPIMPETLIKLNGVFEVIFGLALLLGFYTRVAAFLLAFHMLNIVFAVGYSATGVRDFGLMLATFGVFLYGPDRFTLDSYISGRQMLRSRTASL